MAIIFLRIFFQRNIKRGELVAVCQAMVVMISFVWLFRRRAQSLIQNYSEFLQCLAMRQVKSWTDATNIQAVAEAMEACASAHYWAREIAALGHDTRLIPPAYAKPFVKRQKNDMADAEAICEAAQRPTMRFAQGKSAQARASAVVFRTRDILVHQRTQLINALRGHLTEFGYVVR